MYVSTRLDPGKVVHFHDLAAALVEILSCVFQLFLPQDNRHERITAFADPAANRVEVERGVLTGARARTTESTGLPSMWKMVPSGIGVSVKPG